MSLRSRNPVVKLTRLEDDKLVFKMDRSVVTRSSKRRREQEKESELKPPRKKKSKVKPSTPEPKEDNAPTTRSSRHSERTKKQRAMEKEDNKAVKEKDKESPKIKEEKSKLGDRSKPKEDKSKMKDEKPKEKQPGWEEEFVAFKRSLRMPASLIKITTPPGWPKPRPSASLPDLDSRSGSPLTCDSFDMVEEKKVERKTSFLNELAQRYGAHKKMKAKKIETSSSSGKCRIIPQSRDSKAKLLTPQVDEPQPGHPRKTRRELRRDTIRRVFGDDRPASAPPGPLDATPSVTRPSSLPHTSRLASSVQPSVPSRVKSPEEIKKKKKVEQGKKKKKISPVCRTGLRSATKLRSNKVLLRQRIQKKRRRLSSQCTVNKALNLGQNCEQNKIDQGLAAPRAHRKLRPMRRKFRSSGFDYLRKKKKRTKPPPVEEEREETQKKVLMTMHSFGNTIEDIGSEIRSWVINKHHGETPLHRAARLGYIDAVAYCLEKFPNGPAPKDNAGYTPLHEAASHGWLDIARLLLMYGADPSTSALGGIRPLHDAAEKGCVEMVRLLLSYGADPLLASYAGHTPLSISSDETTSKLLNYHLADVRGEEAPSWYFAGPASCFDKQTFVGFEPLAKVNTKHLEPPPDLSDVSIEMSDFPLPNVYIIRSEPPTEHWTLFTELQPHLKPPRTKDSLSKSLGVEPAHLFRDLKAAEFGELVQCTSLGVPVKTKGKKITLVKYGEELKRLLSIETCVVPAV